MFNNQMLYDRRMTVRMDREAERVDYRPQKLPEGLRSIGMGLGAGGNPLQDVSRKCPLLNFIVTSPQIMMLPFFVYFRWSVGHAAIFRICRYFVHFIRAFGT